MVLYTMNLYCITIITNVYSFYSPLNLLNQIMNNKEQSLIDRVWSPILVQSNQYTVEGFDQLITVVCV